MTRPPAASHSQPAIPTKPTPDGTQAMHRLVVARYAESLSAAGVPVERYNAPTLVHGFVSFALVVPAAAEATNRGLAALKAALHRG